MKDKKIGESHNKIDNSEKINGNYIKRTPYNVLNILEENINFYSEKEKDTIIKDKKEKLLNAALEMLETESNFRKKQKIELYIQELNESYKLIKNEEGRREYKKQLTAKEEKNIHSHILEYNSKLIDNIRDSENNKLPQKAIKRAEVEKTEKILLENNEGRNIELTQIATIAFRNWTGVNTSYINEYEVRRKVDGKEKIDKIYTDLETQYLKKSKKTRMPSNLEYYDFVVNKLLSEKSIRDSKYNAGYIGLIGKKEDKSYFLTLEQEKLSQKEQEILTAIMIENQKQENREDIEENKEEK